jgi:hypothetical protein
MGARECRTIAIARGKVSRDLCLRRHELFLVRIESDRNGLSRDEVESVTSRDDPIAVAKLDARLTTKR